MDTIGKVNYVLVNTEILPSVYNKVLEAKRLIASGEATSATMAAQMAGISRSAYYKYKDAIFEYSSSANDDIVTIRAKLKDSVGVLSSFMTELYKAGANVLSVNQSVPTSGVADVSVTVRVAEMQMNIDDLLVVLNNLGGVNGAALS